MHDFKWATASLTRTGSLMTGQLTLFPLGTASSLDSSLQVGIVCAHHHILSVRLTSGKVIAAC